MSPLMRVGLIVLLILLYAIVVYNKFVSLRVQVQNATSDVDVQLKRRSDLIPNLVETVK